MAAGLQGNTSRPGRWLFLRVLGSIIALLGALATAGGTIITIMQFNNSLSDPPPSPTPAKSPALDTMTPFMIRNGTSGKCLDNYGFSQMDANIIVQWECNNLENQIWYWTGEQALKNASSGKCLDVYAFGVNNGTSIVQWSCNGLANQRWKIDHDRNGNPRLLTFNGKCLDNYGFSAQNGNAQVLWDCNGEPNQIWYFIARKTGS